jgi:dihydroorotate dehydrogenase (fumarate)
MRELLDPSIDIVGVGGVESGTDVFEMLLCGATAVQIGTKHWIEGPACFDRIAGELEELMLKKGYKSIDEFKGKLKPWSKEGVALSRKAKKAAGETALVSTKAGGGAGAGGSATMSAFCAVLVMIIAVLLADKFDALSLKLGANF